MVDLKVQSAILVDALKLNLNMFLSHAQSISESARQTDTHTHTPFVLIGWTNLGGSRYFEKPQQISVEHFANLFRNGDMIQAECRNFTLSARAWDREGVMLLFPRASSRTRHQTSRVRTAFILMRLNRTLIRAWCHHFQEAPTWEFHHKSETHRIASVRLSE